MTISAVLRFFIVLAVLSVSLAAAPVRAGGLAPAAPQPAMSELKAGLAVDYLLIDALHVDNIEAAGRGKPGKSLLTLNWNMGSGPILTHADDDQVAARITGFIRFEAAGEYLMKIKSNDGARLSIGGQVVIDDPDVHLDRFSGTAKVAVPTAGWYPVYMLYFERRGTATLELHWQPPGTGAFDVVPAAAFAHLPKG
ncbi:MAG: hypothetical protein HN478_03975 [Rhodospirillaceae bacterium]|jgi:hypothetical protein|nr:hypothetical protein [Rhodospirillaceae bacterium]MBT4490770.1 hypothetical protein [Rhodospirillaceae bacterium]MBT5897292.1 hypothetical protein [Rhodospirillaceae bacterium]MBT6426737.1 hypothetical protein [Rhodospirillaceae bacterium]MBT7758331.1 hypothetical protein [Rhodospirillaceae bacterium]